MVCEELVVRNGKEHPVKVWTLAECRKWRSVKLDGLINELFSRMGLVQYELKQEILFSTEEIAGKLGARERDVLRSVTRIVGREGIQELTPFEMPVKRSACGTDNDSREATSRLCEVIDKLFIGKKMYRTKHITANRRVTQIAFVTCDVVAELVLANLQVMDPEAYARFCVILDELKEKEKELVKTHIDVQARHIALKEGEESAFCHVPVTFPDETTLHYKWVLRRLGRTEAMDVLGALYIVNHSRKTLRAAEQRLNEYFPGIDDTTFALESFPDPMIESNAQFFRDYFERVQKDLEARFPDLQNRVYDFKEVKKKNKSGYRIRKFADKAGSYNKPPEKLALPKPLSASAVKKQQKEADLRARIRAEILEELGL